MSEATRAGSRPWGWLVVGGVLTVLGIGVLWPLREVGQVCIMIYPPPPGCGAEEPRWVPFVGIGLIIALLCTMIVVYSTVAAPRIVLVLLAAGIVLVVALAAAIVGLSQTGIWDAPTLYPPIMID